MIPVILISSSAEDTDVWLRTYYETHGIAAHSRFLVEPHDTVLTIEQIRSIQRMLSVQAAETRAFVLEQFDSASEIVQNAFLKTLEEKSENTGFILVAQNHETIIPTIRSRCSTIFLQKKNEIQSVEWDAVFSLLLEKPAISILAHPTLQKITRERAVEFLDAYITALHKRIRSFHPQAHEIARYCLERKKLLTRNNLNPQLTIDMVVLFCIRHHESDVTT